MRGAGTAASASRHLRIAYQRGFLLRGPCRRDFSAKREGTVGFIGLGNMGELIVHRALALHRIDVDIPFAQSALLYSRTHYHMFRSSTPTVEQISRPIV